MHILYFHQHFSTPSGSIGTRSYEMARELIRRGHKVSMVCGSYDLANTGLATAPRRGIREGNVDGIHVIEICLPYSNYSGPIRRGITFLKFALKSLRIALRVDYDLLFATSTPLTVGIPAVVMRVLKPHKPFVFEVRDLWPELPKAAGVIKNPVVLTGMSLLEKLSYMCARACIGLSPGIVEGIRRRCNPRKPVIMVPNGCDMNLFQTDSTSNSVAQASAALAAEVADGPPTLPQAGFRAVFAGAHGMANGLDAVLDAAAVLKRRGDTDIQLAFIGDGKMKPSLVARAKAERLDNCVFVRPVPKKDLARLLSSVDAGLMILADVTAFCYGTSPNKFFDYIAAGLPVVNNYRGWIADLIKEHQCGIAVPPGAPKALADALTTLARDRQLCLDMGAHARRLAEQSFDRAKLAGEFAEFLERTCGHMCKQGRNFFGPVL